MSKVFVLRLDLGNGTKIKDVQVWNSEEIAGSEAQTLDCKVLGSVDMARLPIWVRLPNEYICYTNSSTATAYFRTKLLKKRSPGRGIIVEVLSPSPSRVFMVFYTATAKNGPSQIKSSLIDISLKRRLDEQLLSDETSKSRHLSLSKDQSIDAIVAKKQQRRTENSSRISKQVQMSDFKRSFVSILSNCILGGLRLRGIPERQSDFQQLYKMTYSAAEFAFRNELKDTTNPIPFEQVQETVEQILKLFTKS